MIYSTRLHSKQRWLYPFVSGRGEIWYEPVDRGVTRIRHVARSPTVKLDQASVQQRARWAKTLLTLMTGSPLYDELPIRLEESLVSSLIRLGCHARGYAIWPGQAMSRSLRTTVPNAHQGTVLPDFQPRGGRQSEIRSNRPISRVFG